MQQLSPQDALKEFEQPTQYISSQERVILQDKVARVAIFALLFLLAFSIAAGGYWYIQNKTILEKTPTTATASRIVVITPVVVQNNHANVILNLHALPIGDRKVSSVPKAGFVYSCQTNFAKKIANNTLSWIDADTWDIEEKPSVEGSITWSNARFTVTNNKVTRVIQSNGLPVSGTTGIFPISSSDPAYAFDKNSYGIREQQILFSLPLNPQQGNPQCVPMGMIGITLNGVPIFNALTTEGLDAGVHEVEDSCNGHPQEQGIYHYHGPSSCIPGIDKPNQLIGYALDGFGIYSGIDENGNDISSADLDDCHGITSDILWDGKHVLMYHYVLTQDYPYAIGCFRGEKVAKVTGIN